MQVRIVTLFAATYLLYYHVLEQNAKCHMYLKYLLRSTGGIVASVSDCLHSLCVATIPNVKVVSQQFLKTWQMLRTFFHCELVPDVVSYGDQLAF